MNTDTLQSITSRWPADTIKVNRTDGFDHFTQLPRTSADANALQKYLHINSEDSDAIRNFATANGLKYSVDGNDLLATGLEAVPGWLGPRTNTSKPIFAHRCIGSYHGYPIEIQLSYTVAALQNKYDTEVRQNKQSIIEFTLPAQFPQLVLDSNKNESSGVRAYPTSFESGQKQILEGDFSNYFDFYAPDGLQANTLTVLAPNFMQKLIDTSRVFDVEFYGNKLYFILNDCVYDPNVQASVFQAIDVQLEYIERLLQSWQYTPREQPFDKLVTTYVQGATLKVGKLRLSAGQTLLAIVAGLFLFGIVIILLNKLKDS